MFRNQFDLFYCFISISICSSYFSQLFCFLCIIWSDDMDPKVNKTILTQKNTHFKTVYNKICLPSFQYETKKWKAREKRRYCLVEEKNWFITSLFVVHRVYFAGSKLVLGPEQNESKSDPHLTRQLTRKLAIFGAFHVTHECQKYRKTREKKKRNFIQTWIVRNVEFSKYK